MAWEQVTVSYGKATYPAMRNGDMVQMGGDIGSPKTVKIDGKPAEVIGVTVDMRDGVVILKLSDESPIEEKSDGEPVEGADESEDRAE